MFRLSKKFPSNVLKIRHNGPYKNQLIRYAKQYSKESTGPEKTVNTGTAYTVGFLTLVGSATIGYAKYDDDFRKYLIDKVPFSDKVIKFIFQEEKTYYENLTSLFFNEPEVKSISDKNATLSNISSNVKGKTPKSTDVSNEIKKIDPVRIIEKQPTKKYEEKSDSIEKPTKKQSDVSGATSLLDIETQLIRLADEADVAYSHAILSLEDYVKDVCSIIDDSFEKLDSSFWFELKKKADTNKSYAEAAEKSACESLERINKLKITLNQHKFSDAEATVEAVKKKLQLIEKNIIDAKGKLANEYDKLNITEKYWKKTEEARKFFEQELQTLYPSISLTEHKLKIPESEFDLFIMHAFSKILFYQKELIKMQTLSEARLQKALDAAKLEGEDANLIKEQIQSELDEAKRNLEMEYHTKILTIQAEAEREVRNQLKRQSEAHSDHLNDALKIKQQELEREFKHRLDEQIVKEQLSYKSQLAAMIGRLKGMDEALKVRADADKNTHQAQVLWATCQTLYNSVRGGTPGAVTKVRPLKNEVSAVSSASSHGDELVTAVLAGIPNEAIERGVFPESALRERFINVERLARRLALVPENGGRLPLFLLSYIQSMLVIRTGSKISTEELNDEKIDFGKLDTYDILYRARYWLDRGDFAQTLKYMNLLSGASRVIARDWMNEARILIETQQAAVTLMAHAASSGRLV